jgi:hypothetical protein
MKKIFSIFLAIFCFLICSASFAQMVVPHEWDNRDSIRFGTYMNWSLGIFAMPSAEVFLQLDTICVNWNEEWGPIPGDANLGDHILGSSIPYTVNGFWPPPGDIALKFKQFLYYALPGNIARNPDGLGRIWQYNDACGLSGFNPNAKYFYNNYDSNDISAYSEFPKDSALAVAKFFTHRYDSTGHPGGATSGDTVSVCHEGRVILGISNARDADQMFFESRNYYFSPDTSNGYKVDTAKNSNPDTAKAFSLNLTFNLSGPIDTMLANGTPSDSLPLVRLQALFKPKGQETLPLVPFKTQADSTKAGWWIVLDKIITKSEYDALDDDWRVPDTLENGSKARSWKFKQFHVQLNLPYLLDSIAKKHVITNDSKFRDFTYGSHDVWPTIYTHQDSLTESINLITTARQLFEMRVLSTYRDTVRIRSLVFEDTITDKFLYRKPEGATSHSLDPNGKRGGFDSIMDITMHRYSDSLRGNQSEINYIDVRLAFTPYAAAMIGYLDYFGSKYKVHGHIHEQDNGSWTELYRRSRNGYDGQVPSMFENEGDPYDGDEVHTPFVQAFPGDYVYYGHPQGSSSSWPNAGDTLMGLQFTRKTTGADPYVSYRRFDTLYNGISYLADNARMSVRTAHDHPKKKRFAIEANIPIWGALNKHTVWSAPNQDTGHWIYDEKAAKWHQHLTTPEQVTGNIYGLLANGITALNIAQFYNVPSPYWSEPGILTPNSIPDTIGSYPYHWIHNFNFGHDHTSFWRWTNATETDSVRHDEWTNGTNDVDGSLPNYYLAYSNNWRALQRAMGRINQIYDTNASNKIPFKRFTWLNAYSANRTSVFGINVSDTATYHKAFFQCYKTTKVDPWKRGTKGEYIDDTTSAGKLVVDTAARTFAEVGLFKDSINSGSKKYAALVVNTRMYPSLRDEDDSGYYNQGFEAAADSNQRCRSIYGDIDVRKFWFSIDTNNFDPSFRAPYYVIKDLWHPDSVWLVKNDSNFAVYIKPGDAKFLYFEKGITIQAAKTATVTSNGDFLFNNGRRVAERMKGTRTVETYTRDGKLYVSNAARGKTIPGYNERSDGDNIATGNEICIDTSTKCHRPSICVGPNDTSIAIAYWKAPDEIWAAYQAHPDSGWHTMHDLTYSCKDSSSDYSWVIPVLAPLTDTSWIIAAGYRRDVTDSIGHPVSGIIGARFRFEPEPGTGNHTIAFLTGDGFQYLYRDLATDTGLLKQSYFPTIASRPNLPDSCWPVRLAWQKGGIDMSVNPPVPSSIILGRRITWRNDIVTTPSLDAVNNISRGLPSNCYNVHPNIAMCGIFDNWSGALFAPMSLNDYVVWEAIVFSPFNTNQKYYPILRQYTQKLYKRNGNWKAQYQMFWPDTSVTGFRYPLVSAANYAKTKAFSNFPQRGTRYYHDILRLVWGNNSDTIQFAHWINGWYNTVLGEKGMYPSIGLTTENITNWNINAVVPLSTVFAGDETYLGNKHIRITNGWSPLIDYTPGRIPKKVIAIKKVDTLSPCNIVYGANAVIDPHMTMIKVGGTGSDTIQWSQSDPLDPTILDEAWPITPLNPIEIHSDSITLHAGDSLYIRRSFVMTDTIKIRGALASNTDTLMLDFVLRKASDSSFVGLIEHSYITKINNIILPGTAGLNANFAKYKYPTGSTTQAVFVSAELKRTQLDSLERNVFETEFSDTTYPDEAFKRTDQPQSQSVISTLKVTVAPNPFTHSTTVKIKSTEGLLTKVEVFDLLGNKIGDLFNGEFPNSPIEVNFEAAALSAGSYLVRVQSGNAVETRKVELIK